MLSHRQILVVAKEVVVKTIIVPVSIFESARSFTGGKDDAFGGELDNIDDWFGILFVVFHCCNSLLGFDGFGEGSADGFLFIVGLFAFGIGIVFKHLGDAINLWSVEVVFAVQENISGGA